MNAINLYYADSWGRKPFSQPYLKTNASIATKITNLLFPKNELTGRRTLKIIPNFLINARGRLNYELAAPFYKTLKDPELNRVIQSVFDKLVIQTQKAYPSTKNMSWEVRIKKDPTVNASCFPGGKIVITTGFIETLRVRIDKNNRISHEDLIVSVLAHEMIHAVAEHNAINIHLALLKYFIQKTFICLGLSLTHPVPLLQLNIRQRFLACLAQTKEIINKYCHEKVSKWLCRQLERRLKGFSPVIILMNLSFYLFLYQMLRLLFDRQYSQSQELEADKYGIFLAKASGFNPRVCLSTQEILMSLRGEENKPKSWLKRVKGLVHTHPYSQVRLQENQKTISILEEKEKID